MENMRPGIFSDYNPHRKKRWYEQEKVYKFNLPVSIDLARERIEKAFKAEITSGGGFLSTTLTFIGYIDNSDIEIFFKSYTGGRGTTCYAFGTIDGNSKESQVTITTRKKSYLIFMVPLSIILIYQSGVFFGLFSCVFLVFFCY
jgi:hypothetical protein